MANTHWNPADLNTTTLSGGNLTATSTGTTGYVRAVDYQLAGSGKFYWEVKFGTLAGANTGVGFCDIILPNPSGATAASLSAVFRAGTIWVNGSNTGSTLGARSANDVISIALDLVGGLVWYRVAPAGNWNGSGTANPATGTGGISVSSIAGADAAPITTWGASGDAVTANFGDSAFTGAVPSGFTSGFPTSVPLVAPGPNTTWSPIDRVIGITLSNGNLTATQSSGAGGVRTIDGQAAGKFYWEVTLVSLGGSSESTGALDHNIAITNGSGGSGLVGLGSSFGFGPMNSGATWVNGVSTGVSFGARANGDVICFAVDLNARLVWFRVGAAGNWNANAGYNPATGVGGIAHTFGGAIPLYPTCYASTIGHAYTANFGDSAFTGTVPSGFTAGFTSGAVIGTNALATQAAIEHWLTTNVPAQVTQVALEHWASVAASYPVPLTPAMMLSASRAGIGSVVLVQDNTTLTPMLADIGAVAQIAQIVPTPPGGAGAYAMILA